MDGDLHTPYLEERSKTAIGLKSAGYFLYQQEEHSFVPRLQQSIIPLEHECYDHP